MAYVYYVYLITDGEEFPVHRLLLDKCSRDIRYLLIGMTQRNHTRRFTAEQACNFINYIERCTAEQACNFINYIEGLLISLSGFFLFCHAVFRGCFILFFHARQTVCFI
ncbi:hypothetical protein ACF0H5_015155 [Mactra antiquata]